VFSSAFTNVSESSFSVNPFAKLFLRNIETLYLIGITDFDKFASLGLVVFLDDAFRFVQSFD
ncbi:MAG: hypothetical protein AAFO04_12210, partial [Cyanobacteria bacterium J06592_8]